jgi:hypothetical protein
MREIDPETWLMIGVAWFHGLLCGYAIWRERKNTEQNFSVFLVSN